MSLGQVHKICSPLNKAILILFAVIIAIPSFYLCIHENHHVCISFEEHQNDHQHHQCRDYSFRSQYFLHTAQPHGILISAIIILFDLNSSFIIQPALKAYYPFAIFLQKLQTVRLLI